MSKEITNPCIQIGKRMADELRDLLYERRCACADNSRGKLVAELLAEWDLAYAEWLAEQYPQDGAVDPILFVPRSEPDRPK